MTRSGEAQSVSSSWRICRNFKCRGKRARRPERRRAKSALDIAALQMQNRPIAIGSTVWRAVQKWIYSYGLSACCIVAPVLLGFVALDLTASMLTHRVAVLELHYEFLSASELPPAASVAEGKQIAGKSEQDFAMTFLAKDLRGRVFFAVASAFLYLASAAAIGYGLLVVCLRNGARIAFGGYALLHILRVSRCLGPRELSTYFGRWSSSKS